MRRYLGLIVALSSAISYAFTVNIIPIAHAAGGSVMLYLAMRGMFNFGLTFIPSPNRGGIFFLCKKQPLLLFLLSCFVALQGLTYVIALHLLPISVATPLFFLFPVMTYLLQKILQRRSIHLFALVALGVSSVGVWLLAQGDDSGSDLLLLGVACALLGGFSQAIVNVMITRIDGLDAWQMLRASYLISCVIYVGYIVTQPIAPFAAIGWTALSAGIFFLGSVLFFQAIKLLGAIRTSNVTYFEPILSVFLSVMLHDDNLSATKIFAIILIVGATLSLEYHEYRAQKTYV